jgi:uncharacterized protein
VGKRLTGYQTTRWGLLAIVNKVTYSLDLLESAAGINKRVDFHEKKANNLCPERMSAKLFHEIRDPIHVFIHLDSDERTVVDSAFFQRLRHINQLALSYLIYPGATHKRFEHSLGVMELAGRVFDVVTKQDNLTDGIRNLLPDLKHPSRLDYWRRVLRMAALCHDVGHLPFSHAAEHELLPQGWTHERISRAIIESAEMQAIWSAMKPPLLPADITKLAIGAKHASDLQFSTWERVLSEIIVGDAFGVDRIDYLLRDSHHTGVAYGKFDHYRLIDELRILPSFAKSSEPALGIKEGGIHSAESMALARYFMFSQVYFHSIRLIYDRHLQDFLTAWLSENSLFSGTFSTLLHEHLMMTDNEVNAAMRTAAFDNRKAGHHSARTILAHQHYKVLYERNPQDIKLNSEPGAAIREAAISQFGAEAIRYSNPRLKSVGADFPVQMRDERVLPAIAVSDTLSLLKPRAIEYVYVRPELHEEATAWLEKNREQILSTKGKAEDEGE